MESRVFNASLASFWTPEYTPISGWISHGPFAFWLTERLRPRRFVELGTHYGYSFFAFCQAIKKLGSATAAYAVDTWKGDIHAGHYAEDVFLTVEAHNIRYQEFATLVRATFDDALSGFADNSIDLIHIDGQHLFEDVKKDYHAWLPKLTDDAVVLLHDTQVRERDFGVWRFFDELKRHHPSFEFVHGHGLGIICPRGRVPHALEGLLRADLEQTAATRLVYASLGDAVEQRQRAALVEERDRALAIQTASLATSVQEAAAYRDGCAERDAMILEQQSQLADALKDVAAFRDGCAERDAMIFDQQSQLANALRDVAAFRDGCAERDLQIIALREEALAERKSHQALRNSSTSSAK